MPEYHDFELLQESQIPEMNSAARLFRHKQTGAQLLSIKNDDENKVFSINFRTPPSDSTGVAHILEHAVLNGSEKYPVKEPFVELIKGSLQTFVNAFTFPDKTCYPVASQNIQDLYNLVDVYMDAVLHPLIPPHILDQEGWHYQLEEEEGEMIYKGVVFNEMKGAMSDPQGLLGELSQQSLFPDNTYGFNSGGDPVEIPNLTYEQFKGFHEAFYHPSNAYVFWYGDDPEEERLKKLSGYFAGYQKREVDSAIPLQSAFKEPKHIAEPYAVGEGEEAKNYIVVNWVLAENNQPEITLGLTILSHILVGTQASPLRKALIDSGLGEDVTGGGLGWYLRQLTFSSGLKGVSPENTDKVQNLIVDTLKKLAEDGIDPDMIAAAMNTVEFRLRENNTGQFPRGIFTMIRALTTWLHGGDPVAPLAFEAPLNSLKAKLEAGERVFEEMISDFLLANSHRTTIVLEPDPELNQRKAEQEAARISEVRQKMTLEESKAVVENTHKLKQIQETPDSPEALATLPVLTLNDLDKENKRIPLEETEESGAKALYHDIFTNGIIYLDVGFDLHSLPQETIPYLDLFSDGLVKMGTESEDFVKLSQRIGRETGGIAPTLLVDTVHGTKGSAAHLLLRGKATGEKAGEMLAIMRDVLLTTNYDNPERFKQIVLENKAKLESSLIPAGHSMVNRRLRSKQSEAGWLSEQLGGISQLFFLRGLVEQIEVDWAGVLAKFEEIRGLVFNRSAMLCNVTVDPVTYQGFKPLMANFIKEMPAMGFERQSWMPEFGSGPEGLTIPAQVNYVGKGANLYDLGYQLDGSNAVIRKYLGTTYMWEKIRVQGGAYGAMLSFDQNSGAFNFLSYRDPNLLGSLDNYDGAPDFLRGLEISEGELTKSIIGSIGDMDAHLLPDAKGYSSMVRYLTGFSDEARQAYREQILSASKADFKAFAEALDAVRENGQVVVLGSAEAIQEANQEREGFLDVMQVM